MGIRSSEQSLIVAALQPSLDSLPTFNYDTDAFEIVGEPTLKINRDTVRRETVKQTLGASGEIVTSLYVELTFSVEMKGGGVDGSGNVLEPRIARLFRACGFSMSQNIDATSGLVTSYTLTPSSQEFGTDNKPAIAFEVFLGSDGSSADKFTILNAAGNFKYNGSVGNYGIVEFTFIGQLYDGPTTTTVPTVSYEDTQPYPFLCADITFDGNNTFVFRSLSLDSGTDIVIRKDVRSCTGIIGVLPRKRNITATLDPEATFASTYDWYNQLKNGAKVAISAGPVGQDAGNKYTISAPAAQLTNIDNTGVDGILTYNVSLLLTEVNGDDELTITFE